MINIDCNIYSQFIHKHLKVQIMAMGQYHLSPATLHNCYLKSITIHPIYLTNLIRSINSIDYTKTKTQSNPHLPPSSYSHSKLIIIQLILTLIDEIQNQEIYF